MLARAPEMNDNMGKKNDELKSKAVSLAALDQQSLS